MNFSDLGLSHSLLRAVESKGYDTPSPIQQQAIPAILSRRDVMAAAQTGTGKTAAFTLPLLHNLSDGEAAHPNKVRALILVPTRELAAQVSDNITIYGKHLPLRSCVVFGGVSIQPQIKLLRRGTDILVATPGRLLDLCQQNVIRFSQLETLILDEADRMLDMGFIRDIRKILALLPKRRQNLLFSATFSDSIKKLAGSLLHDPIQIEVSPRNTTAQTVKQSVIEVEQTQKSRLLCGLISEQQWQQVLVFTRTKHGANRLTTQLEKSGITAAAIHGNKSQGARTRALTHFKSGEIRVLVATDIAARGIDINQLPHVINFELPNVAEDYVHRIGRTGRAGANGEALSLVGSDENKQLKAIEKLIQKTLPRKQIAGHTATATPAQPRPAAKPATHGNSRRPQARTS